MSKSGIRTEIKNLIIKNSPTLANQSREICKKIIESKEFKNAKEIFGYMALPDEVDLTMVIQQALCTGKKVAVPKIMDQGNAQIQFFYLNCSQKIETQTQDGTFGIAEPDSDVLEAAELSDTPTLFLVPGRAFTKNGDRLGRGKGYYDRFLAKEIVGSSPTMTRSSYNITVAGVCFDFQVLPELPTDPNDIAMDIMFY